MERFKSINLCGPMRAAAILLTLMIFNARAEELELKLKLEHQSVLQYEPLYAFLEIKNDSGMPFVIGDDDSIFLRFRIRLRQDEYAEKRQGGRIVNYFKVDPGETRTLVIELTRWYDLRRERAYAVQAELNAWGRVYVSDTAGVEVVPGILLSRRTRAVTGYDHLRRTYSLRYWARDRSEFLFLRVDEEPTNVTYGSHLLGRVVRVMEPELKVDAYGNVHVLHQTSNGVFTRSVFKSTPEGLTFIKQTHHNQRGELLNPDPEPLLDDAKTKNKE